MGQNFIDVDVDSRAVPFSISCIGSSVELKTTPGRKTKYMSSLLSNCGSPPEITIPLAREKLSGGIREVPTANITALFTAYTVPSGATAVRPIRST